MAGTVGDIIQLTDVQSYLSQEVLNVYYYRVDDVPTPGYLSGLADEWTEIVLPPIRALQHQLLTHVALRLENIFNGDLLEQPYTPALAGLLASGSSITTATPSYASMVFSLKRQNTRVRNGRKSIAGLSESLVSGNAIVDATSGMDAIANAMAAQLNAGGGIDFFTPTIVGRVPYDTAEGNPAYRLPVSQAEMADNFSLVNLASASLVPSTMNTRKLGRGT